MRYTDVKLLVGHKTLNADNLRAALQILGRDWVRLSRRILDQNKKNATFNLRKSMSYTFAAKEEKIGVSLTFDGAPYWVFVEMGVRGFASADKAPDSPFQFGTKTGRPGGLRAAIDKWVIRKGLPNFRDAQGRFIPRKEQVRRISKKIYMYGIEPTPFVSEPMKFIWDKHLPNLEEALTRDVDAYYDKEFPKDFKFVIL